MRVMFTVSTISATSSHVMISFPAFWGNSILLSVSVEFLTVPRNSAANVLSYADLRLTVVMRICLLTVCHICTDGFETPVAATVVLIRTRHAGSGIASAGSEAGVR